MKPIIVLIVLSTVFLGCTPTIRVETPDKPLEINLNVKVDQVIRVQVDKEIESVMKKNKDIF